ncbi:MAG: cell division protein FtsQ/DivIB [Pseudomonadota bacterium]
MEKLGQRLDETGSLLATGAFQLTVLGLISGGLVLFMMSVFSGAIATFPERLAALPETAARSVGLNVMTVTVKGGDALTDRQIMNALRDERRGSIIGRPILLTDAEALRERIMALGPVRDASVQKLLPDTIHISVTTRAGKALYQNAEGAFFVIDASGVIISEVSATEYTELPVVSGTSDPVKVIPFLEDLRSFPVLYARTAGIEMISDRRVDLRFRNGFLVMLPETEVDRALQRLQSLDAGTGSLSSNLNYLDLRNPDWAYFQPKEK